MQQRKWPTQAESQRIEAIAILWRIEELAESAFDALERNDPIEAARRLGELKRKATKGKYLLKFQPEQAIFDNELTD